MGKGIGKKIQVIGNIVGWLYLIGGLILWLVHIYNSAGYYGDDYLGWVIVISSCVGHISSWLIVGFGQLVEDVHIMRSKIIQSDTAIYDELPEL